MNLLVALDSALAVMRFLSGGKRLTELGVQRVYAGLPASTSAWPEPIEGAEHGDVEYELRRAYWRP